MNMDAHSNPRRVLKLAQKQEDWRRRRNERDRARRAAETKTKEQKIEKSEGEESLNFM